MATGPFATNSAVGSNMMCMGMPVLNYAYVNMMCNSTNSTCGPHNGETALGVPRNLPMPSMNQSGDSSAVRVIPTADGKSVFGCNFCGKSFSIWGHLQLHLRTHSMDSTNTDRMSNSVDEKPIAMFKCNFCPKTFNDWGPYQLHMVAHLGDKTGSTAHSTSHGKQAETSKFEKTGDSRNTFPVSTQAEEIPGSFKPNQAPINKPMLFVCNYCAKSFESRELLNEHIECHNVERKVADTVQAIPDAGNDISFDCNMCAKTFTARELFHDHMKGHATDRAAAYMMYTANREMPYKCNVCGESFKILMDLQSHIKSHTNQVFGSVVGSGVSNKNGEKPFHCNICSKSYEVWGHLQSHMKKHIPKTKAADGQSAEEKMFKCQVCEKSYDIWGHLQSHMKKHTGSGQSDGPMPFKCEVCGKMFAARAHLQGHMKSHGEPAVCEVCGKEFQSQNHLQRHRIIHTGERPHKCDVCGMRFIRKEHCKRHIMTHVADKSITCSCELCGKNFSRREHLHRHYRMHTGEKPFKCDLCEKEYSRKDRLQHHMKSHEKEVRDVLMGSGLPVTGLSAGGSMVGMSLPIVCHSQSTITTSGPVPTTSESSLGHGAPSSESSCDHTRSGSEPLLAHGRSNSMSMHTIPETSRTGLIRMNDPTHSVVSESSVSMSRPSSVSLPMVNESAVSHSSMSGSMAMSRAPHTPPFSQSGHTNRPMSMISHPNLGQDGSGIRPMSVVSESVSDNIMSSVSQSIINVPIPLASEAAMNQRMSGMIK